MSRCYQSCFVQEIVIGLARTVLDHDHTDAYAEMQSQSCVITLGRRQAHPLQGSSGNERSFRVNTRS